MFAEIHNYGCIFDIVYLYENEVASLHKVQAPDS